MNNIDDKDKNTIFTVRRNAFPLFRTSVSIPVKSLTENEIKYNGLKLLDKDHELYAQADSNKIYIHSFSTETLGQKITYDFYSYDEETKDNVSFVSLVVKFSKL